MDTVSIRELNANISKVIARVEAGEAIEITRNGKVVAEIRAKRPKRDAEWWKTYREMVAMMEKGLPLAIGKITEEDKYGDAEL